MMPYIPQTPDLPNNLPAPPKSNKKLWAILGSIVSVMIVLMGCSKDTSPNGSPVGTNSAASSGTASQTSSGANAAAGQTGGLAGTWKGPLQCSGGETQEFTYKVAGSGNPIFVYQTNNGQREAELTASGQRVEFVPPGGGVVKLVVNSLSVSPDRISYAINATEESSYGGTLEQREASITTDARRSGAELELELTGRSSSVVSQPGIVVPPSESTSTCRGKLRKE